MVELRRAFAALAPLLVGAACADEPEVWTRIAVSEEFEGFERYRIAQADPLADTCVRIDLIPFDGAGLGEVYGMQDGEVDVDVRGFDGVYVNFTYGERPNPEYPDAWIARDCAAREWTSDVGPPAPRVSGEIEFREFRSASGGPCRVDFDLEVRSVVLTFNDATGDYDESEDRYEVRARDVGIYAEGCPHPGNAEASFTVLDAAYAELDGLGSVVVASFDASNEVCAWVRLLSSADGLASPSDVDVSSGWAYGGVGVAAIEREACTAAQLVDPLGASAGLSSSAGPLGSSGSVRFGATKTVEAAAGSVEAPCSLDVDLRANSYADYHWVPDVVHMRARSVPVAGACD